MATDSPSIDPALAPGTLVGPFRIERKLGAGGVGTVYAAVDASIHKRVAIKVLKHAFAEDPAAVERFRREAQTANGVRHPGIVDVFALGTLPDGRPYLVMSLLEGRSLREELAARGRLPAAEAWRIARDVAEIVAAAHEAGVVHRDLKPDNVFLERFGDRPARLRVLDFGLAKVLQPDGEGAAADAGGARLTQTGVMLGTPLYMAPEQWFAAGVGPATDQYALGAMLYEMLSGRPPFDTSHVPRLLQQHLNEPVPALPAAVAGEAPGFDAVIARAMAKRADARFAGLVDMVRAGDEALEAGPRADRGLVAGATVTMPEAVAAMAATIQSDQRRASGALDERVANGPGDQAMPAGPARPGAAAAAAPAAGAGPAAAAETAPAVGGATGAWRFAAVHAGVIVLSLAGLLAVGYVGPGRRSLMHWILIAGWGAWMSWLFFAAGVVAMIAIGRRRARGHRDRAAWWLALVPALTGAFGTYTGWMNVIGGAAAAPATLRFAIFGSGMYEANANRFMGFAFSGILCLSLVALAGVSARSAATVQFRLGLGRRESFGGIAVLVALAVAAALSGAPSAALVAGAGALALALGLLLPAGDPERAAEDELERGVAGLLAVVFATGVGFARIEAREGLLWIDEAFPDRAARAAEIVAAAGERTATTVLALAALAVLAGVEGIRVARLRRRGALQRPRARTIVLAVALLAAGILDGALYSRMLGARDAHREALANRFALLGRFEPPVAAALPAGQFVPGVAPALQIGRDVAAVEGDAVARLNAADLDSLLRARLTAVLADAAAARAADGIEPADLALTVDREVPWGTVQRLLRVAHDAGVRRLEVLLARSPAPAVSPGAPIETTWLAPTDFFAVPAVLVAAGGLDAPATEPFARVAETLAAAALASPGTPTALSLGARAP